MAPIQNAQFQDSTLMNPDTSGPRMGPKVVAAYGQHVIMDWSLALKNASTYHEDSHASPSTNRVMINVRTDTPDHRNRTTTSNADEQSEDDQRSKVWCDGRRDRKDSKHCKSVDHDTLPSIGL